MDTPVVNGVAYPYLEVEPRAYRFRILNAANDRFFNLQWYIADPDVKVKDGLKKRKGTEVRMIPAKARPGLPPDWPVDGREGGVPDPATVGPEWIQIGTEGGFLPAPVVIPNQPITWNTDPTTFNFGNVDKHSLLLGTAERADVIVDFSGYAGKTLILYNDAPAAFPASDARVDYYTGNPDMTDTGGPVSTRPGYGPNTRTIMQVRVKKGPVATPYDLEALRKVFKKKKSEGKRGVFEALNETIIFPQEFYSLAYDESFPGDVNTAFIRQYEISKTFKPIEATEPVTISIEPKAIQDEMGEAFDPDYGRMSAMLGLEFPTPGAGRQNFMLYGYLSPPVDIIRASLVGDQIGVFPDGTQIWRITHNGVDTHTLHTHLFHSQLINRVAWDGAIIPPETNELGWKDTIRVNPLEHTIIALRPLLPRNLPFKVGNSVRLIDPTMAEGMPLRVPTPGGGLVDPLGNPVTVFNHYINFGWEYVFHCHLLAHEEMDMMHAMAVAVAPEAPSGLSAEAQIGGIKLTWTDNSSEETGFVIQRAEDPNFTVGVTTFKVGENTTTYIDTTGLPGSLYYYRVKAQNVVGDTEIHPPPAVGFPNVTVESPWTDPVSVAIIAMARSLKPLS